MSVAGLGGGIDVHRFYIGADGRGVVHGLVNIVAQAMVTSIKFDVCDEFQRDDASTGECL